MMRRVRTALMDDSRTSTIRKNNGVVGNVIYADKPIAAPPFSILNYRNLRA